MQENGGSTADSCMPRQGGEDFPMNTQPLITRTNSARACDLLAIDLLDLDGIREVVLCEWPDASGYFTISDAGEICATVLNESEVFATEAEAMQWLYPRVKGL